MYKEGANATLFIHSISFTMPRNMVYVRVLIGLLLGLNQLKKDCTFCGLEKLSNTIKSSPWFIVIF